VLEEKDGEKVEKEEQEAGEKEKFWTYGRTQFAVWTFMGTAVLGSIAAVYIAGTRDPDKEFTHRGINPSRE